MEKKNQWALITGGSSGIGKAVSYQFAKNGYNVVICSEDPDRLAKAAQELSSIYPVEVRAIAKDLTAATGPEELYEDIKRLEIKIDFLVNDAGIGQWGEFWTVPIEKDVEIIALNVIALTKLTKFFLSEMVARNEGKILNLGSIAGFTPGPLLSVYHGTKAYVVSFSEAIAEELKDTAITVTCLCPGVTETDFPKRANMEETKAFKEEESMDPTEVAETGYAAMMDGERIIIPGAKNKIQTFIRRIMTKEQQARSEKKHYEMVEEDE
jgi:short-subunit dehydrogenase